MRSPPLRTLNNCARVFRELWPGRVEHIKPAPSGQKHIMLSLAETMKAGNVTLFRNLFGEGESEKELIR
eukprot:13291859-Alexandrium_andersonii.AAC.1